jgi:hypothetical protein
VRHEIPFGTDFGSEFVALSMDLVDWGTKSRNNFRALPRIPCPAARPGREFGLPSQGILHTRAGNHSSGQGNALL